MCKICHPSSASASPNKLASLAAKYTLPAVAYDRDLIDELWDATGGALPEVDPAVIEKVKKAWIPVLASRLTVGG